MNIVYYKTVNIEGKGKRLAKFTAKLNMISEKRGIITEVKIKPVAKDDKISADYHKQLVQHELGKGKNISACYECESME